MPGTAIATVPPHGTAGPSLGPLERQNRRKHCGTQRMNAGHTEKSHCHQHSSLSWINTFSLLLMLSDGSEGPESWPWSHTSATSSSCHLLAPLSAWCIAQRLKGFREEETTSNVSPAPLNTLTQLLQLLSVRRPGRDSESLVIKIYFSPL